MGFNSGFKGLSSCYVYAAVHGLRTVLLRVCRCARATYRVVNISVCRVLSLRLSAVVNYLTTRM